MSAVVCCPGCGSEVPLSPEQSGGGVLTCPNCRRTVVSGGTVVSPKLDESVGTPRTVVRPKPGEATGAWVGSVSASTSAPTEPTIAPGAILGTKYQIETELGSGAFGVVYKALDTELNRAVAIKVLYGKALATPDAVRRFQSEANILLTIDHPHVPQVFAVGEHAGQQYIVLRFIPGKTVKKLIQEGALNDPIEAVRLVAKLVGTLHDIHVGWKILHRDVKPDNMMVPSIQKGGLYLMDFGLGVHDYSDATRTQDGTILGTPAYMSPEQARGLIKDIDHRSDLYSAAAVLYHLLTGRPPFLGDTTLSICIAHCNDIPEPPSKYRPNLKLELGDKKLVDDLEAIVLKGLEKNPANRYQTGTEFAKALDLWAARAQVGGRGPIPIPVGPPPQPPSPVGTTSTNTGSVLRVRPLTQNPKVGEGSSIVGGTTVNAPRPTPKPLTTKPASKPEPVPEPKPLEPIIQTRPKVAPIKREYRSLFVKLGVVVFSLVLLLGFGLLAWKVYQLDHTPAPSAPTEPKPQPKKTYQV